MTIQTVTDAIRYVGVDDNTLALFENQYPVQPMGVSYNSYVILDENLFVWVKFIQQVMGRIAYHFFFSTRVSRTSCNF